MSRPRVSSLRALILSLSFAMALPAAAQAPAAQSSAVQAPAAQAQTSPPAASVPDDGAAKAAQAAEAAKAEARRREVKAAIDASAERLRARKIDDAIALLEDTDKKIPDDALVAAALGTAYELKGDPARALEWVREGARRDSSQHHASEWLHARILEARLALGKDPKWFDGHSVLDLDFGKGEVPVAPEILPIEQGRIKGAQQLLDQINYQLEERAKFVAPPDAIAGDLYASAGDLAIAGAVSPLDDRKSKIQPDSYYERALEYGAPHADLVRKRLARYRADLAALPAAPKEDVAEYPVGNRFESPAGQSNTWWYYGGAAALATIALIVFGIVMDRRRRKRAEATPAAPLPDVD